MERTHRHPAELPPRKVPASTMLPDVRGALARHKKKACLVFLLAMGTAAAAAAWLPRTYRSEGKLLVRLGRENATLDTTVSPGQEPVVALPMSRENEINSLVEVLRSRATVEKVVDALDPDAILGLPPSSRESVSAPSRRERAVLCVQQRLSVVPVRRSTIIDIICEGPSPQWAHAVVDKLIELYQAEHIRLSRPAGSLEFFAQQTARLREELFSREAELRDLKSATGITSPDDQRKALVDRISLLQAELAEAAAGVPVSQAKLEQLHSQLNALPENQVASSTAGHGNQATDLMREELYRLQLSREEAAAEYTDHHPVMQQIEQQLAAAQEIVDRQQPTRTQTTTITNPLYEDTRMSLLEEESTLVSLQAKATALQTQLADARGDLEVFNQDELRIVQVERDVELARANYRAYASSVERARVDHALAVQQMSNISVVQSATLESRPIRPQKALLLVCGLLSGLLGALGVALAADSLDRRFYTPEDVERGLDLSVLGSVPHVREGKLKLSGNGRP
ncbi:MAG: hypothetical protein JXB62_11200 [Pirellulales bacterium]|nr:hypothetical protein [Pirellulales bacterium]